MAAEMYDEDDMTPEQFQAEFEHGIPVTRVGTGTTVIMQDDGEPPIVPAPLTNLPGGAVSVMPSETHSATAHAPVVMSAPLKSEPTPTSEKQGEFVAS